MVSIGAGKREQRAFGRHQIHLYGYEREKITPPNLFIDQKYGKVAPKGVAFSCFSAIVSNKDCNIV
jgi:hypothetical protein